MDSKKSFRNLGETLHALLGLKANLTPNWVQSVCDIVQHLPTNTTSDDSGNAISRVQDEIKALNIQLNQLNIQRRQLLNDFLDLKGNIRVFCRIRPITLAENFGQIRPVVAVDSSNVLLKLADSKSKSYSFDKVFQPGSSQDEVFSEVEPVIKSVIDGYNACIFAYGQTGTGKTYTMEGRPDAPGVVPQTFQALFKQATDSNHSFLISFSMLEIYMGNLKDLLVPKPTRPTDPISPCLSIQTGVEGGVEIENLVSIQVNDFHQALRLYRLGCRFRSTASTNSNTTSSRSHCMIRISITCFDAPERRRATNKIWLVDLGGSERVLKTKAWGRRLDEGKAINLSLSALGDVINALQSKKRHIPYRNSKLTQVLKDSLGDDSKTLMLVHVSPKEEDICETVCSLNFATRAKSIHLGNEDTIEVRVQKEEAMANLQQRITEIEVEQLNVRREVLKLNKTLENLTGEAPSSEDQLEAYCFMEEPLTKNKAGYTTAAPITKLPRFMRPTICSRKKSGTSHQISEQKVPVSGKRRKPSSQYAESVALPVKDHPDHKSEHSISRASCIMGLDRRDSADNATEYSQDTMESDIKMVDVQEQENVLRSSASQKSDITHISEYNNRQTAMSNYNQFSKVDNWLHLQKNESNKSGYTHRRKRVLAIPKPEKKHKHNDQIRGKEAFDAKEHSLRDPRIWKDVKHTKKDKPVTSRTASEVGIHTPAITLQDLFTEDGRSDFSSITQTTEEKKIIQTQDSLDSSSKEDEEWSIVSQEDVYCQRFGNHKDHNQALSIMEKVISKKQILDNFQLKNNEYFDVLQSDLDSSIIYSKWDSDDSASILEVESFSHHVSNETIAEVCQRKHIDSAIQTSAKERRHDVLNKRSQRALFVNYSELDINKHTHMTQEEPQARGICQMLKQKIETVFAIALLGLGFYNLGYEQEFFYSLML